MLQHATAPPHRRKRRSKAALIVPGTVVLAAVTPEVDASKIRPQLAGRVSNNRVGAGVGASVAGSIPTRIGAEQSRVRTERIDEQCSYATHGELTG